MRLISVSGLCGNYNNEKSDDFTGADGEIHSFDKFGGFKSSVSWIVPNQDDPECDTGNENPEICDVTEEIKEKCNFMKSEYFSGKFSKYMLQCNANEII